MGRGRFKLMFSRIVLLAVAAHWTSAAPNIDCSVPDSSKNDCGYVGIDQPTCENKGCCWVSSSSPGVPWCYYPAGVDSDCYVPYNGTTAPFSASEVNTMRGFWLANFNIQNNGGIVAAPDYNTPGGSYYFHWMRDAALSVRGLLTTSNPGDYDTVLKNYVQWVLRVQSENDPNGIDVRTEPKFNLPNGDVYSGGWCRPQNDGPGLRATALMDYASWLIANNQTAYVKQYLWTGNPSVNKGGAIKYDLDWVVNGWSSNGCDLWEEVQSNDFFWNRITSKYALLTGSGFASNFGDASSATSYKNAGLAINSTLYASHYNGAYIQESSNRQKDAAVVCGLNSGFWSGDNLFAPTSIEVANTIKTLNSLFCSSYAINTVDSQNGVPGVLYGRYQGDSYAGGNPWVLLTAALGQLLYRGAHALLESQEMPDASTLEAWHAVFGDAYDPVVHSTPIMLSKLFASAGDGPLYRLRRHVEGNGFHLQEQIDRNTGFQLSAHDLTWSYTEVLVAMQKRTQYIRAAKELFPEQTARDPYFA